jgi:hydroxyacylglutathione hydrolase
MLIKHFIVGPIETNCYLVACEESLEAIVIDPDIRKQEEKEKLFNEIRQRNLKLKYIFNTHHHTDHTAGNAMLKKATGAQILIHELDAPVLPEQWKWVLKMSKVGKQPNCPMCGSDKVFTKFFEEQREAMFGCRDCGFKFGIIPSPPADLLLHDGDVVKVGQLEFIVIHTPGHSPGGISLYIEKEKVVFTGDTLFKSSIGRTDLLDSSRENIIESVNALMKLPADTIVYPGHGEKTTIGREKRDNPYVQT